MSMKCHQSKCTVLGYALKKEHQQCSMEHKTDWLDGSGRKTFKIDSHLLLMGTNYLRTMHNYPEMLLKTITEYEYQKFYSSSYSVSCLSSIHNILAHLTHNQTQCAKGQQLKNVFQIQNGFLFLYYKERFNLTFADTLILGVHDFITHF